MFDSDETEEWEETLNKLAANMRCIEQAERLHWEEQQGGKVDGGYVGGELGVGDEIRINGGSEKVDMAG